MPLETVIKILPDPKYRVVREHVTAEALSAIARADVQPGKRLDAHPDFGHKVRRFDAALPLDQADAKKFETVVDADKRVVDYRNVRIKGYLSTFGNVDRDGEVVIPGAFKETIERFKLNPIMLVNHRNSVETAAGVFETIREDDKGLYVEARISDAPGMTDLRFKVVEGVIRSMSMGGAFHFDETGRNIFKVDLFEGSLVGIPANPMALISTRELDSEDVKRIKMLSV